MNVIIKERSYQYESDYPDGWLFAAGDYFKYPVKVGPHECFIKRFEHQNPSDISGWKLMVNLKYKNEIYFPHVYDITTTEENGKRINYVFYRSLKGQTLDKLIDADMPLNLQQLTDDLFGAMDRLTFYQHWFADFCEKNIFQEEKGNFLLLDIDSAQSNDKLPDSSMFGSKEYWALVLNFYKEIVKDADFRISNLSGIALNYLQIIFLILRLKIIFSDKNHQFDYEKLFHDLPSYLNILDEKFKVLFIKMVKEKDWSYEDLLPQINVLITERIINNNDIPEVFKPASPLIKAFAVNKTKVKSGEQVVLTWQVESSNLIELYKNNALQSVYNNDPGQAEVLVFYDGGNKEMSFQIKAVNGVGKVASEVLLVEVFVEKPPISPIPNNKPSKVVSYKLMLIIAASIVALIVLIFILLPEKNVEITSVTPMHVYNYETITVHGKNLVKKNTAPKIFFDKVQGTIRQIFNDSIQVDFPTGQNRLLINRTVLVSVIINKDTFYAPHKIYVLRNLPKPVR